MHFTKYLLICAALLPQLGAAQHEVEEVIVVGSLREQSTAQLAQSVTILRNEQLDRARATNLGETLEGELGMSASFFGAGASRPIIRGLAGARVRTLEDGIDSMDVSTVSADHAVGIDPLVAKQIEIFRGPTSLLYGSGAIGGVINTVTNRVPEAVPDSGFDAAFELRADSAADERTTVVALDGGKDRLAWHFDGARRDTDDYEIPGFASQNPATSLSAPSGKLQNSGLELSSYAMGGAWLGQSASFGAAFSGFETVYGVPIRAEAAPAMPPETVRIDVDQNRLDLKGRWSQPVGAAIEAVNLRIGINDYEHVELEGAEVGTRFTNDAHEGRIEFLHTPWGRWSGAFGLQFGAREFAAIGDEAFVPPVDSTNYGLFALEELQLEDWRFSVGARVEEQTHDPSGSAQRVSDTAVSFSAAGIHDFGNDYALILNYAAAERLPVAEELFAFGPHLASGIIEIGDANLRSETAHHFDVGFRKTAGERTWTVTGFVTRYDDFIFLRDSGFVDPVEDLPVFGFAQQDATLTGFETEFFSPLGNVGRGELDLRLYADRVDAELADGEHLPRIPPLRYGARLEYHDERLVAGFEATEYDTQNDLAPFETRTPGYTMVNADLSWQLPGDGEFAFSILARATNLLDEDARRHASLVKAFAPLPGRNLSLAFRALF